MKFIDGYVRSPFAGIAPWILFMTFFAHQVTRFIAD